MTKINSRQHITRNGVIKRNPQKIQITDANKYDTKDIALWIRQSLKERFGNDLVFSVQKESYSGGSTIHIALMESKRIRIVEKPENLTESYIAKYKESYQTREIVLNRQKQDYFQLNKYQTREPYSNLNWNNGVLLTEKGHNILREVVEIADKHNWDRSDAMSDYFDVNYYISLNLGKWNKPFKDGYL